MRSLRLLVTAIAMPLAAQWLDYPAPGIPRTSDGKPDLAAPAPRLSGGKPDFSGMWKRDSPYSSDIAIDLESGDMLPGAQAIYQRRIEQFAKESMGVLCLPEGPRYSTRGGLFKIVHTPLLALMLQEDLTYRQIFLDGRALPHDPNPNWMGYSVGHWEDDTLVIQSAGFNDRTWLDGTGHPHTENLRLTERYRRPDFGHLELKVTLEDPGAYAKPWTLTMSAVLQPDTDLLEYVCNESEKGKLHLVGEVSEDRKRAVEVAPSILEQYTGTYQLTLDGHATEVAISLAGRELLIDRGGRGNQPMIPISETLFSSVAGTYEFVPNAQGEVTYIIYKQVESDLKGPRTNPR